MEFFSKLLLVMDLEARSLHSSVESEVVYTLRLLMLELIWSVKSNPTSLKTVLKTLLPLLIMLVITSVMSPV